MERIESVIFDWGGVLIDDPAPRRLRYCAKALGVPEEDLAEAIGKLMPAFQKGKISENAFWQSACGELTVPPPNVQSLWADGFDAAYAPRPDMFSIAIRLQELTLKTAVLSNTEVPAMQYFARMRYDMFDVLVFSCAEATRKPETRIYEIACEKLGSPPGQTVFIDDDPKYIDAAKHAGLNTVLFESIDRVKSELARLGVRID